MTGDETVALPSTWAMPLVASSGSPHRCYTFVSFWTVAATKLRFAEYARIIEKSFIDRGLVGFRIAFFRVALSHERSRDFVCGPASVGRRRRGGYA